MATVKSRTAKVCGIAVVLIAGAGSAVWLKSAYGPSDAAPSSTQRSAVPERTVPTASQARTAPSGNQSGDSVDSPAVAGDPPALVHAMAQRAYDGFGPRLVDYLARQGLPRVDAETIVVELMRKTAVCALDALREQALEQRVELEQVLDALEAELHDADGPPVAAVVDAGAADRRALPCSMTALTQAGIPPQAASELFPRQGR
jgi:hypothetical protein